MKKNLSIVNQLLMIVIFIGTLICALFFYQADRLFSYIAVIPVLVVPFIFEKSTFRLDNMDKAIYYLFILFAYYLGCIINLYNITWWYDIVIHFISGIVSGYLGYYVLKRMGLYQKDKKLFNFLFCFAFSLMIAGLWEIGEFSMDIVSGSNLQHSLETGVTDTMEDVICGTLGGMLYATFNLGMCNALRKNK